MTKEEIKEYLKDNLSIDVSVSTEGFYGANQVKVRIYLKLEGKL